jgi:SAM-dependent methyltransferase
VSDGRERWSETYEADEFELPSRPMPALPRLIDAFPPGRALDVATGTGRNARYLAREGYAVEAVDVSGEALDRAATLADEDGVEGVDWIRADVDDVEFEASTYDVITVSFFAALDLLPDLKTALAPGGVLCYEHHLRSSDPVDAGPSNDRYRFRSNDLLRACLDLTVLEYRERLRVDSDGRRRAVATLVARNSSGGRQSYPLETEE